MSLLKKTIFFILCLLFSASTLFAKDFATLKIKNLSGIIKKYSSTSQRNALNKSIIGQNSSPMFDRIVSNLSGMYKKIAEREANNALNSGYGVGSLNTPSFRWSQPFGEINIAVRRQVDPDLFHDTRYIVVDELVISIDAYKLMSNLKGDELIDITDEFLAMYAGLEFRRVYRFSHYADDFVTGLTSNYQHLFFPFFLFKRGMINELEQYQYIERTDQITANIGGAVNYPIPIYGGISLNARAGMMAGYENLTKASIRIFGEDESSNYDGEEKVRVTYEKESTLSAGAFAEIRLDFLKILELTLFKYEVEYLNTTAHKMYLSFKNGQVETMNDAAKSAMDKLLLGVPFNSEVFNSYKVSEDYRKKKSLASNYTILFWNGSNFKQTDQIDTIKEGVKKTYFKHQESKSKMSKSFWQMILPNLLQRFLNIALVNTYRELDERNVNVEYENEVNLLENNEALNISAETEKMTASISTKYYVKKIGRSKRRIAKMTGLLRAYAVIDQQIIDWVDSKDLVGPMNFYVKSQVSEAGIEWFNQKSEKQVKYDIKSICKNYDRLRSRGSFFTRRKCQKDLKNVYKKYRKSKGKNKIRIAEFKTLFSKVAKYVASSVDLERLFGKENIFVFGKFSASTKENTSFVHSFKYGELKSFSVIQTNMELPRLINQN